ncbi:galactose mutarotase [Caballeronia sp. LZ065]|uniref:aldose epimerase family protein n=1 Tax=Caballeronia sp. LZ065 TaxID=3038571 RepID=UPI0028675367|nr:aldose epimerase family protein [Caballeronia sp. LZ065]MDR5782041.1 galactose mutarotase [Caballeronia sp. LZ065]
MTHSTSITLRRWGNVQVYTLHNESGMQIDISDLGATLLSWRAPDRDGRFADVLLGHDAPDDYLNSTAFMGAIIGRWANRIRDGRFAIDGIDYQVERNEGVNHLHGGSAGFHRQVWQARIDGAALIMSLRSEAGAAGFPGNLDVNVRYALDAHGTLSIDYEAHTDAPTALNLTNHAYFNLSGSPAPAADIRDHEITIASDAIFAIDAASIPVAREDVAGTAFDLRQPQSIRARLDESNEQLKLAGGFDHCYVLHDGKAQELRTVAIVHDASSGRKLQVATDAPGLQFYTGNHLEGETGRDEARYRKHAGLCLEAGGFPNGINMDGLARSNAVLRPGESYRQRTRYTLGVR